MKAILLTTITTNMKLLLFIFLFQTVSFSQESISKESPNNSQQPQEVILQKSDLELNGLNSSQITDEISQSDLVKLRTFDFSGYRNYYNPQEVQIENGPKIILYSIEKMISIGQTFETQFIDSKKNVDETSVTHPIIPVINIGYGKITAPEFH